MPSTEHFRSLLTEQLEAVTNELKTIAHQDKETGDWIATPEADSRGNADENVGADVTEDWNERRAVLEQLEIRYRNITRALKKIEGGMFGTCEISGEPIEPERLEANPAARTNIANRDREAELPL